MNKVILSGRLTRDPEVRYNDAGTGIARYTLAVERRYKKDGEADADFINCVVFGKAVEFVEKFLHKGSKILVCGRIQTGSYTNKDGQKIYTTDVVVDEHEFAESKGNADNQQGSSKSQQSSKKSNNGSTNNTNQDGFMNIPDEVDEDDLPFN